MSSPNEKMCSETFVKGLIVFVIILLIVLVILDIKSKNNEKFSNKLPPKPKPYIPDSKCKNYYDILIKNLNNECSRKNQNLVSQIQQKQILINDKNTQISELQNQLQVCQTRLRENITPILSDFVANVSPLNNSLRIVLSGQDFGSKFGPNASDYDNFVYIDTATPIYLQDYGLVQGRMPDEFVKSYTDNEIIIETTPLTQVIVNLCLKIVKHNQSNEFTAVPMCRNVTTGLIDNNLTIEEVVPSFDMGNMTLTIKGRNFGNNQNNLQVMLSQGRFTTNNNQISSQNYITDFITSFSQNLQISPEVDSIIILTFPNVSISFQMMEIGVRNINTNQYSIKSFQVNPPSNMSN